MEHTMSPESWFELINQYFVELERQGPGSAEETIRALGFMENLSSESKIADLGSGTGSQTMVLAQHTEAHITALDLYAGSIERLNQTAEERGLQNRVQGIVGSMDDLPFSEEELDVIWSEGAIANIGFEHALAYWKRFLKKGGYLAFTYESWFTEERPAEIEKFWTEAVPEIDTIANNVSALQKAGYQPVAVFTLPESAWTENYFLMQKSRQEEFLVQHPANEAVEELVASLRHEEELYARYKEFYGYVFYIGKKL